MSSAIDGYQAGGAASATLQDLADGQEGQDEPEDDALIFDTGKLGNDDIGGFH